MHVANEAHAFRSDSGQVAPAQSTHSTPSAAGCWYRWGLRVVRSLRRVPSRVFRVCEARSVAYISARLYGIRGLNEVMGRVFRLSSQFDK